MVVIQNVSKVYRLYRRPSDRLLEALPWTGGARHVDFWAVRDVSLQVERGESLAIVGPNGSGKSTLLALAAGILQPTRGRVLTRGRVAALLELGAGFNPEFTGRENVFLNAEIMGLSRREVERKFPSIAAFAEIGAFMDRPVKEYSSGMYVRLAFAAAIHVEPDILIVDEALAVGDAIFSNRCVHRLDQMRADGVTVVFVSHDLGMVKHLASRAALMLDGRVAAEGHPRDVVNRYVGIVHDREAQRLSPPGESLTPSFRHGDGASRIVEIQMLDAAGQPVTSLASGDLVTIRVVARFERDVEEPVAGVLVRNRLGIDVWGTNTRIEDRPLGRFVAGERLEISFRFDCLLTRQEYTLTVAMQHWDGRSQDWLDDALAFSVADPKDVAGFAHLPTVITWRRT